MAENAGIVRLLTIHLETDQVASQNLVCLPPGEQKTLYSVGWEEEDAVNLRDAAQK